MVDKVAFGQVYLRLLRLSLVCYHSTNTSHTFINHQGLWKVQNSQERSQYSRLRSHRTARLKIPIRYMCIQHILFTIRKNYIWYFSAYQRRSKHKSDIIINFVPKSRAAVRWLAFHRVPSLQYQSGHKSSFASPLQATNWTYTLNMVATTSFMRSLQLIIHC
jgi:hypothetical protein